MWLNTSNRRIFFDMHLPDWPETNIANNFDPEHIAESFKKNHVDSVIAYAKCQFGNFYYDTQIGHKHSGLGKTDFFGGMIEACHQRDISVIAYYSVSWDEYVAERHPEWIVRKSDGTQDTDEYRWKTLCINSPYRDIVKSHIKEIMTLVKPDGFWIDMTIIGTDRCYCEHCQKKFKELYGFDIPKQGDDNYNVFKTFRYDYIEAFYKELRELVKAMDENVQMANNYWGYPYCSSIVGSRAIGSLQSADFVTGEAYTDWTGLNAPSFFTKYLRGVSQGKPYEALIGRFYNTWDFTAKPFVQLAYEAYTTVANGACVTIDDEPYHDGSIDEDLYDHIGEIFGNIQKREAYLGGTHKKYAAVFHSIATKDYYHENSVESFIKSIAGSYKMLRDLHLPVDFVFDENIATEDLKDYKLIILPSVSVLDDESGKALKAYVEAGGTVVLAGACGLYHIEDHQLKEDFTRVNRFFGLDVEDKGAYSLSFMDGFEMPRVSLVKGEYVKYKKRNDALAHIVEPICETTKERFYHNNLPSPYNKIDAPACFVSQLGEGKIIAFAQPIFTHYAKQSQLELRKVFKEVVTDTVGAHDVILNGPNRLDIDAWEKDNQIIIHLLNPNPAMTVCCGIMDAFENSYPRTFEYMDEVIPVYDFEVQVKGTFGKEQITCLDQEHFDVEQREEYTIIKVKKLELWETIIIKK